jgi:hypothetical protein
VSAFNCLFLSFCLFSGGVAEEQREVPASLVTSGKRFVVNLAEKMATDGNRARPPLQNLASFVLHFLIPLFDLGTDISKHDFCSWSSASNYNASYNTSTTSVYGLFILIVFHTTITLFLRFKQ